MLIKRFWTGCKIFLTACQVIGLEWPRPLRAMESFQPPRPQTGRSRGSQVLRLSLTVSDSTFDSEIQYICCGSTGVLWPETPFVNLWVPALQFFALRGRPDKIQQYGTWLKTAPRTDRSQGEVWD